VVEHRVRHVIVAFTAAPDRAVVGLVRRCSDLRLSIWLVPRLFEVKTRLPGATHVGAVPLVESRPVDPASWAFSVKYMLETVVALLILIVTAPILLAAAIVVRATLGPPVLFHQPRVGLGGRQFDMLKLRTMSPCADLAVIDSRATATAIASDPA
jgi:lipopolysaccharide/colanic/teichoic acid biosynthesis glycosyltransferase